MSAVVPLPQEVLHFLQRPPPETMLVRGLAGTGKTSFALTLLTAFPGRRIYVTSRVSPAKLARDFPWIGEDGSGVSVVDASSRPATVRETARALDRVKELLVDGDGGNDGAALWLPSPIQEAWALTRPGEPAMVVIDSWDAVVERYLGVPAPLDGGLPDRAEMERLVLDQLSRGPVHSVLVLEREQAPQLDYLVNGVLSTGRVTADERADRWLHLHKLRGVRLDSESYPFTLENARFQCITPIQPGLQPSLCAPEPEPESGPGFLWPGSLDYATNFGRLGIGQITLFETESGVPDGSVRLLLAPMEAQVIQGGGRVYHVLPPRISPKDIWEVYRPFVSVEAFRRQVRLQSPLPPSESEEPALEDVMLPHPRTGDPGGHHRTPEALRFLREAHATGAPCLMIVWASGLRSLGSISGEPYQPETLPAIVSEYATGTNLHGIFVGNDGDPLTESMRSMAKTRLRFRRRGGRVFVYGTQPMTPPFVLVQGDGERTYQLLRVV